MELQSFALKPYQTKKGRKVANKFVTVIPDIKDLGIAIQRIAAAEIQGQIALKNPPKNLIVDNSEAIPFNQAKFRVQAFFSDARLVAEATHALYQQLRSVTRVGRKRRAINSYELWTIQTNKDKGKRVGKFPMSIKTLQQYADKLPVTGSLIVAGPMTDYGRKLYWNPRFGPRTRKTSVRNYKGAFDILTGKPIAVQGSRSKNMHDIILRRIRAKFPGVPIYGRWVVDKTRVVGKSKAPDRWPGIGVGFKTKGVLK